MAFSIERAARRALVCSSLVNQNVKQRPPDQDDIRALSACVAQLASCVMLMAASNPSLKDPYLKAKNLEFLLQPDALPERYAALVSHYFRASIELEGDILGLDKDAAREDDSGPMP